MNGIPRIVSLLVIVLVSALLRTVFDDLVGFDVPTNFPRLAHDVFTLVCGGVLYWGITYAFGKQPCDGINPGTR